MCRVPHNLRPGQLEVTLWLGSGRGLLFSTVTIGGRFTLGAGSSSPLAIGSLAGGRRLVLNAVDDVAQPFDDAVPTANKV